MRKLTHTLGQLYVIKIRKEEEEIKRNYRENNPKIYATIILKGRTNG